MTTHGSLTARPSRFPLLSRKARVLVVAPAAHRPTQTPHGSRPATAPESSPLPVASSGEQPLASCSRSPVAAAETPGFPPTHTLSTQSQSPLIVPVFSRSPRALPTCS